MQYAFGAAHNVTARRSHWAHVTGALRMSTRSMSLAPDIYGYLLQHAVREAPVLERLRAVTA